MTISEAIKILKIKKYEQLERNFRLLSKQTHPDKGGTAEAMHKLIEARDLVRANAAIVRTALAPKREITKDTAGKIFMEFLG